MACQYFYKDQWMSEEELQQAYQTDSTVSSTASAKTLARVKDFLERIGVEVTTGENLPDGVNGRANALKGLIEVVEGKEDVALTEEAMHMAVELIEQKNPELFKAMFNKVSSYALFSAVASEYGQLPSYQLANGKPNVVKLKKEAMAKLLAEHVIQATEGSTEKPELIIQVKTWWEKIKAFLSGLFGKANYNPFEDAVDTILNEDLGTIAEVKNDSGEFLQLSPEDKTAWEASHAKQASVWNSIVAERSQTIKNVSGNNVVNEYLRPNEGNRRVEKRVSDIVKSKMPGSKNFDENDPRIKFLGEYGSLIHSDIENIIKRYTDEDGYLLTNIAGELTPAPIGSIATTAPQYAMMEAWLREMLQEYNSDPKLKGVRIMTEAIVYQPEVGKKAEYAGTIDFLAVLPDGQVDILDWKSYDLNKEKYHDVPWYKVQHVGYQIGEYKKMLKANYGVTEFRRMRGIPIAMGLGFQKDTKMWFVKNFEIGKFNAKQEFRDYVLPIPTEEEKTGNPQLDNFVSKLRKLYERLAAQQVSKKDQIAKAAELNALYSAIRHAQVQENLYQTADYIALLTHQANEFINNYEATLKNASPELLENEEIENYLKKIQRLNDRFIPLANVGVDLADLTKGDEELDLKMAKTARDMNIAHKKLIDTYAEFFNKFVANQHGVKNIASPELPVSRLAAEFNTPSAGNTFALRIFSDLLGQAESLAQIEKQEKVRELTALVEAVKAENPGKNIYSLITKKDEKGNYVHERIDTVDSKFFPLLKTKISDVTKTAKQTKDVVAYHEWLKDNIDIEAYKKWAEEKRKAALAALEGIVFSLNPEEQSDWMRKEKGKIEDRYGLANTKSGGWYQYDLLSKFPLSKWDSAEWKVLQRNPASLALYNYIGARVAKAQEVGFSIYNKRTFLPFVEKGHFSIGNIRTIAPRKIEEGGININTLTGEIEYSLPSSTTKPLREGQKVEDDLHVALTEFDSQLIDYQYRDAVSRQVQALDDLEKMKSSIVPTPGGKASYKENGELNTIPDNDHNYELLKNAIAHSYFMQRNVGDSIGSNVVFTFSENWKLGEKLNKLTHTSIFPTDWAGKAVTVGGIMESASNWFRAKTLTLNLTTSVSNMVGGQFQASINRGVFYTAADDYKANMLMYGIGLRNKESLNFARMLDTQVPFTELEHSRVKKAGGISHMSVMDGAMATHRWADRVVHLSIAMPMYMNAVIVDGKLVNARTYVRKKYADRYTVSAAERGAIEKKMEEEINELKKNNGFLDKITYDDKGVATYPVDKDQLAHYRKLVMSVIKQATGQMTREDRNNINATMLGRSMMTFKNWIPQLYSNRIKGLKYTPSTENLEWGRWNAFGNAVTKGGFNKIATIKNIITGNDKGVQYMREIMEAKKAQFEKNTGQTWEFTEAEFMDMMRQSVAAQAKELAYLALVIAMAFGLRALAPDSDDPDKEARGRWALIVKQARKVEQEMTFFYNPFDIQQMANGSIVPGLGILIDASLLMKHVAKELGDEPDKAHPLKYMLRMIPMAAQANTYVAYLSADYAKEMGVKVEGNAFIR